MSIANNLNTTTNNNNKKQANLNSNLDKYQCQTMVVKQKREDEQQQQQARSQEAAELAAGGNSSGIDLDGDCKHQEQRTKEKRASSKNLIPFNSIDSSELNESNKVKQPQMTQSSRNNNDDDEEQDRDLVVVATKSNCHATTNVQQQHKTQKQTRVVVASHKTHSQAERQKLCEKPHNERSLSTGDSVKTSEHFHRINLICNDSQRQFKASEQDDDFDDDRSSALSATSSLLSQLLNSSCLSQLIEIDCVDKVRRAKDLKHAAAAAADSIQLEQNNLKTSDSNYLTCQLEKHQNHEQQIGNCSSHEHQKQTELENLNLNLARTQREAQINSIVVRSKRQLGRIDFRRRPIFGSPASSRISPQNHHQDQEMRNSTTRLRNHETNWTNINYISSQENREEYEREALNFLKAANSSGLPEASDLVHLQANYNYNQDHHRQQEQEQQHPRNSQEVIDSHLGSAATNHSLVCCCKSRLRPDTCCGFCALISNQAHAEQTATNHERLSKASSSAKLEAIRCRDLSSDQMGPPESKVKVAAEECKTSGGQLDKRHLSSQVLESLRSKDIQRQQHKLLEQFHKQQQQQNQQQSQFDSLLEESRDGSESTQSSRSSPPRPSQNLTNTSIDQIASRLNALRLADQSSATSTTATANGARSPEESRARFRRRSSSSSCNGGTSSSTSNSSASSPLSSTHLQVTQTDQSSSSPTNSFELSSRDSCSISKSKCDLSITRIHSKAIDSILLRHEEPDCDDVDCDSDLTSKLIVGGKCELLASELNSCDERVFVGVAGSQTSIRKQNTSRNTTKRRVIIDETSEAVTPTTTTTTASQRLSQLASLLAEQAGQSHRAATTTANEHQLPVKRSPTRTTTTANSTNGQSMSKASGNISEKRILFELDPTNRRARNSGDGDDQSSVFEVKASFARVISLDSLVVGHPQVSHKMDAREAWSRDNCCDEPIYDLPANERLTPEQKYPSQKVPNTRCEAHYTRTTTNLTLKKSLGLRLLDSPRFNGLNPYQRTVTGKRDDLVKVIRNYDRNLPRRLLRMHHASDTVSRFSRLAIDGSETSGLLDLSTSRRHHRRHTHRRGRTRGHQRRRRLYHVSSSSSASCCSLCCSLATSSSTTTTSTTSTTLSSSFESMTLIDCALCGGCRTSRGRGTRHPRTPRPRCGSSLTSIDSSTSTINDDDRQHDNEHGSLTEEYLRRHRPTQAAAKGAHRSRARRHVGVRLRARSRSDRHYVRGRDDKERRRARTRERRGEQVGMFSPSLSCKSHQASKGRGNNNNRAPFTTGNRSHSHVEERREHAKRDDVTTRQQIAQQHATGHPTAEAIIRVTGEPSSSLIRPTGTTTTVGDSTDLPPTDDKRASFEQARSRFEQAANWRPKSLLIGDTAVISETAAAATGDLRPTTSTPTQTSTKSPAALKSSSTSLKRSSRARRAPTASSSIGTIPRSCGKQRRPHARRVDSAGGRGKGRRIRSGSTTSRSSCSCCCSSLDDERSSLMTSHYNDAPCDDIRSKHNGHHSHNKNKNRNSNYNDHIRIRSKRHYHKNHAAGASDDDNDYERKRRLRREKRSRRRRERRRRRNLRRFKRFSIRKLLRYRRRQQEFERQQFRLQLRNHRYDSGRQDVGAMTSLLESNKNRGFYNNNNNPLGSLQDAETVARGLARRHGKKLLFDHVNGGGGDDFDDAREFQDYYGMAGKLARPVDPKSKSRAKSPLSNLGCWLAAKASGGKLSPLLPLVTGNGATSKLDAVRFNGKRVNATQQQSHLNAIKLSSRIGQQQQQFGWLKTSVALDEPARPVTPRLFGLQLTPPCQCSHCRAVQQLVEVDAQMRLCAKSRHKNILNGRTANNDNHSRFQPQANFLYL